MGGGMRYNLDAERGAFPIGFESRKRSGLPASNPYGSSESSASSVQVIKDARPMPGKRSFNSSSDSSLGRFSRHRPNFSMTHGVG